MCSISGIFNFSRESNIDKIVLENMSLNLKHRGPDGSGEYIDNIVGLSHNRLSIIDTSDRSSQPFKSKNKVLAFNGLVFNYKELKKELEAQGYVFKTNGDTEVVLAAYDYWGAACQKKFNGMWAFVIYDKNNQSIFLSRDRYGIKPLYFSQFQNQLYFASEIKAFLAIPNFQFLLNHNKFSEYIQTGALEYNDETLYENINLLKPGHSITLSVNEKIMEQKPYYQINRASFNGTYDEAKSKFRSLFTEAVNKRLVSDVPLGISLSGGIDSNAILSSIPTSTIQQIQSFSSSDSKDPKSEHDLIKKSADFFKIKNLQIAARSNDFFDRIDQLIYTQEIPFFSTSVFAQNQVFELTKKQNCTVSLSGQGADEMLMGYDLFVKKQILSNPLLFVFNPSKWYYIKNKQRQKTELFEHLNEKFKPLINNKEKETFKDLAYKLFTRSVLPSLLHYEDRNSMKYAVESRVPFLDHHLVDFVFSLNARFLLGEFERKKILKESLEDKIPSFVINNKIKSAYYTPSQKWFEKIPKDFKIDAINKIKKHSNFFSYDINLEKLEGEQLFRLGMIAKWLDRFKIIY